LKAKVGELCKQVDAELWAEHDHTKQSRLAELANVLRPHFATFEEALTLAKAMFNGEIQAGPITFPRSVIGQELARIGQLMDNLKPDHNPHMDPTNRARTLVDIVIPQPAEEPSTEMATV
jgi:hypothetical protein